MVRLAAVLACVALSCDGPSRNAEDAPIDSSAQTPVGNEEIRAHLGGSEIRLGMRESELTKAKRPTAFEIDKQTETTCLSYSQDGIEVYAKEGRVIGVIFMFMAQDSPVFSGETVKGIGAKSTVRDVICTYGQPGIATRVTVGGGAQWPNAERITLMYTEQGVSFDFVNRQLESIVLFVPKSEELRFDRDVGDTEAIRAIMCN